MMMLALGMVELGGVSLGGNVAGVTGQYQVGANSRVLRQAQDERAVFCRARSGLVGLAGVAARQVNNMIRSP